MKRLSLALTLLALTAAPALAHVGQGAHGSFQAGFLHPLAGLDHLLAMVAAGLWASLIAAGTGRRWALWLVPAAFVALMTLGFGAALAGAPLPFVEPVILASVVALGLLVASAVSVPVWAGMAAVGFFALFHGHAHGTELAGAVALPYAAGFALATALLHAVGLGIGMMIGGAPGRLLARIAGAAAALGGVWLALGA
ncbi:MAG TPA: HupE/UreJ family protein [Mesorhizobium sp.]|nr:HupE/UreJ family protein [Mesorhizobium sp.]